MFKLKLVETHLFGVNISKISLIRVVTENMQLSVNKATKLLRLATTRYEMVITATSATPLPYVFTCNLFVLHSVSEFL